LLIFSGGLQIVAAQEPAAADTSAFGQFLDSVGVTESELQAKAASTRLFGGSSPVSFSGEGRVKMQFHNLESDDNSLEKDKCYLQSGWEGNESMIRLGMMVCPGRNAVLYSKIGFQSTLPGQRWLASTSKDGSIDQYHHDKALVSANIHEDMGAGLAIRTVPASFWLRMGNVNWIEASPFTIWKAQPRTFAWEFLPYEVEQPIARYYEYNIANGEKAGRAAWHKKAFNGINFESINLPGNLYLNLAWVAYERYDNFEPEYVDFSNDLAYTGEAFPLKGTGIGDLYRHMFHARLAANKLVGELTPGLNFLLFDYSDDVITAQDANGYLFLKALGAVKYSQTKLKTFKGTAFYKEPKVMSFDIRGPFADRLFDLHADVALTKIDTTYLVWDSSATNEYTKTHRSSSLTPAFYTKLAFAGKLPLQLDFAAIGKGFYSPFSFAIPQDAFYAFNSNMVGSGKFLARGEASPYAQNMIGGLLTATPKIPGYGHFRVAYGQHVQMKPGRDILSFPFRLNGLDYFSFSHSSYTRWGNGYMMSPDDEAQKGRRLGNESFSSSAYMFPRGIESGGTYTDYLSTFYTFVPYDNVENAVRNVASLDTANISNERTVDGVTSQTAFVPVNRKFTNNVEVDISYDISGLLGYHNDLFIGGFAALNNVTTAFSPLAVSAKGEKTQLWSVYLRFEPAIALTKKFYLLGILGFENWRSNKALMNITDTTLSNKYIPSSPMLAVDTTRSATDKRIINRYYSVPIDFRDWAVGLGFDWEVMSRVGLHGRFKYMRHKDVHFSYNDWGTPVVSLEIKTWF